VSLVTDDLASTADLAEPQNDDRVSAGNEPSSLVRPSVAAGPRDAPCLWGNQSSAAGRQCLARPRSGHRVRVARSFVRYKNRKGPKL